MSNVNLAKGLGVADEVSRVSIYKSGGAITVGNFVKFDVSATGQRQADTIVRGTASGLTFGVALTAAHGAGEDVQVCTQGYCSVALTGGAVASGDVVVAAAAGACVTLAAAGILPNLGVALSDDAGTVGELYLFGISISD